MVVYSQKEAKMTDLTQKQKALLDELLKDFKGDANDLLGEHGLIKQLTKHALAAVKGVRPNAGKLSRNLLNNMIISFHKT